MLGERWRERASRTTGAGGEEDQELNPTTRLTVLATQGTIDALGAAAKTNRESPTNVVNRALQLYAFLARHMRREGKQLILRRKGHRGRKERNIRITFH